MGNRTREIHVMQSTILICFQVHHTTLIINHQVCKSTLKYASGSNFEKNHFYPYVQMEPIEPGGTNCKTREI